MKINTSFDISSELQEPLPEGDYVMEYVRDGFSADDRMVEIVCKVIESPDGKHIGEECKIETVYSSENKRLLAIGNSIRNQIFRVCMGTELFNAEKENGAINTNKLYGLRFGCTADVVETNFGLTGFKNRFRGFKCVLTDEEKLTLAKEKFGY